MATVRIYKVAELLNTSSQEVLALLKRAHGIELKSASSTIEEVVARQFVERLARERSITLPGGDMFAEGPVAKPGAKKPAANAKKPEPAKPAAPTLAPPRLVKTAKPAAAASTGRRRARAGRTGAGLRRRRSGTKCRRKSPRRSRKFRPPRLPRRRPGPSLNP